MEVQKNMKPGVNTVLQESIFKTEWENFQVAYRQAKAQNDSKEMKRLYELAHSLTTRNVRFGPPVRINPYFEDLFNKKEFEEFMQSYEEEKDTSSPEHMRDLKAIMMDLAGRTIKPSRINPYFKDMVDKNEYDELMAQIAEANKRQDFEFAQAVSKRVADLRYKNPYVKDHLDKLQFQRITKEIESANKSGNIDAIKKLKQEISEASGRDPNTPPEKINPYIKDDIDKREFESFQTNLSNAQKQGNYNLQKDIIQKAKERSGLYDSRSIPNPYLRQYFDEIEAQKYMDERAEAKKNGDMPNYHRITSLMQHAAGDMWYVTFEYSPSQMPSKTEQPSEKSSFRDSIALPKEEQDRLAEEAKKSAQRIANEQPTQSTSMEGPNIEQ